MELQLYWSDEKFNISKKDSVIVLVDTLRASSVIPVTLYSGAKKVTVVKEENEAGKMLREAYDKINGPGLPMNPNPYWEKIKR